MASWSNADQADAKLAESASTLTDSAVQQVDSADRRTGLAADRTALAGERTYAARVRIGFSAPLLDLWPLHFNAQDSLTRLPVSIRRRSENDRCSGILRLGRRAGLLVRAP